MKWKITLFVLVLILSGIVHFPLSLAYRFFPTNDKLVLANPQGTIWKGSFYPVQWQGTDLGTLSWRFTPWRIVTGKLNVDLLVSGEHNLSIRGDTGVSFAGFYANNLKVNISSPMFQSIIKYPVPIQTSGMLSFTIDDYVMNSPWCKSLVGKGQWKNAKIETPMGIVDLGLTSADLGCDSGAIQVKTKNRSEELDTDLTITYSPDSRFQIKGTLKDNPKLSNSIRSQLKWLGQPDQQGNYTISFGG